MIRPASPFRSTPSASAGLLLLAGLALAPGCAGVNFRAGDGGPVPLDDARAVALARRNVCGPPGSETDRACAVVSHEGAGGIHRVVIDRAPPAGGVAGDRVRVTLRGHGSQVEVEPVDAAAPPRP